jgi:hypothetical protein
MSPSPHSLLALLGLNLFRTLYSTLETGSESRNETMKWRLGLGHDLAEARLGFNFGKRGISRDSRAKETPETLRLIERISILIERYVAYPPTKLLASKSFRCEAENIFVELGPTLWPRLDRVAGPWPT